MSISITKEAVETVAIGLGKGAGMAGTGTAVIYNFLHNNFVAICGLLLAALGYLASILFQRRRDQREQLQFDMVRLEHQRRLEDQERLRHIRDIEHERRMEKMRSQPMPLEGDFQ